MDQANVVVGYGFLYMAPKGTAIPAGVATTQPTSSTWTTDGFTEAGFTDDGVQWEYEPKFKDIDVDESMSPVDVRLIGEELMISCKLAEATLLNLANSIAGSTITEANGVTTLTFGNIANPDAGEIVLAFQGPGPTSLPGGGNAGRVIYCTRAKATAKVTYHAQRKDKVTYNVQWRALADSAQALGAQLATVIDYTQTGS